MEVLRLAMQPIPNFGLRLLLWARATGALGPSILSNARLEGYVLFLLQLVRFLLEPFLPLCLVLCQPLHGLIDRKLGQLFVLQFWAISKSCSGSSSSLNSFAIDSCEFFDRCNSRFFSLFLPASYRREYTSLGACAARPARRAWPTAC